MQQLKKVLQTWGKPIGIIVLLLVAFFAGNVPSFSKQNNVKPNILGVHTTSTPTSMPVPTAVPITVINNIIIPTGVPSASPMPTVVPTVIVVTPTPVQSGTASTPTPAPTETITPTSTPTPIVQTVTVQVDYAGQHAESTYTASITSGETAWQVIQDSLGLSNIQYTDYGGSFGVFITGFNGIEAANNQYYEFQVNGVSSNVGVSSYVVQNGDVLKFALTSF